MPRIDEDALEQMKQLGGAWAAYENKAFDSHNAGHLQFLKVGAGCTCPTPPERYPFDTRHGMGWRYLYVGMVNTETGEIEEVNRG